MAALNRTLGAIRSDIQTRLGFGMAGQAGVVNASLIDSFIRSAQKQLYEDYQWKRLETYVERLTGVEQVLYDYPADCEPENIIQIAIQNSGIWTPLKPGITLSQRSIIGSGQPSRYELRAQMEIHPPPAQQYTMRIEYKQSCGSLTNDNDRTTIDSELVLLHALAAAKAHYRQPDAPQVASQLENMLAKLKAHSRQKTVFRRQEDVEPMPFPRVEGRD